jgi:hypothetical protein
MYDSESSNGPTKSSSPPVPSVVLAKALPKKRKLNYVGRACDLWTEIKGGVVKPGRMGSALKPLIASVRKRHPELASDAEAWEKIEPWYRSYLETTEDRMASPEAFAKAPMQGTPAGDPQRRRELQQLREEEAERAREAEDFDVEGAKLERDRMLAAMRGDQSG